MFNNFIRLYNTVKYLKIKQIVWRVAYLLPRFTTQVNIYPINFDTVKSNHYIPKNIFTNDYINFTFLNETYSLEKTGWDNASISKLWRYNLHYFEYLLQPCKINNNQEDIQFKVIENWLDHNRFGVGTGWEPYPTSLRIINWIKWHWDTNKLSDRAKISLWNQVRWLSLRPEYHLLGNHLFINAKALLYASAFFNLNSDASIYKTAISIIKKEINEQFLEDGAHFELSPMYHSLAMEDLLDLISISDKLPLEFPKNLLIQKFIKGICWLQTMIYVNEELSHFNDCANGIAPKFSKLMNYANELGIEVPCFNESIIHHHKESGFFVFKEFNSHLIADIGKIGPDYLPGHSHSDTLSFELAIKGQRIIVNSGTSIYGNSLERLRQRGTSAHSTIQIDNQDSSEVWSGFRVARRAYTFDVNVSNQGVDFVKVNASHDGYKRLINSPIHSRTYKYSKSLWEISDKISGINNHLVSRYFVHPDIEISRNGAVFVFSKDGEEIAELRFIPSIEVDIIDSTYHDNFGSSVKNKCIQVILKSPYNFSAYFQIL